MSCQIKQVADIGDVHLIRRHLFPTDDDRGGECWLQQSITSASPTGDLMVCARGKKLVLLTGKWNNSKNIMEFSVNESGLLDFADNIQAVLCLPVVIQSQSSQVGPDWTCIIIAFDSGFVGFYTENCTLLHKEQFQNEPVVTLKCQSQHGPRPDINQDLKPEELHVVYESNICVINGYNLFATLRTYRSQLAKGEAFLNGQLNVNMKKWGFVEQSHIEDVAVVGLDLQNTFDHLLTTTICGTFDTKYRAMPPHNNLVLAAGTKPFLGFHYALEGGAQPVLGDVVKAVANRVKSALPGWLTGTKTTPEKTQSLASQPSEGMACRFGLCDLRRNANTVILSPNRRLAAVSDSLGRVLLIDAHRGVALRIFKGYRDAQCAFIQVPDERKTRRGSKIPSALFLIIYSAKKGTLEVLSAQQGAKIATFTASKFSVLLYVNHGMVGFQNTSKSRYVCQFTCLFVDPDGKVKDIVVPFHFALTEQNSKKARDLHLYKRLKQLTKTAELSDEKLLSECLNTCKELKTIEVKLQLMEMLSNCADVSANCLIACSSYFSEKLMGAEGEFDSETKVLQKLSENIYLLSSFYNFLKQTDADLDLDTVNANVSPITGQPLLGSKEMKNLQRLLDLSTLNDYKMQPKVTFKVNTEVNIAEFLNVFDLNQKDIIKLKEASDETKIYSVAETIFKRYLNMKCFDNHLRDLEEESSKSKIAPEYLLFLLLHYWVNRPIDTFINLEQEMQSFSDTVYTLTKIFESDEVSVAYNCISPFWSKVRANLLNSHKPFPALLAAVLCKGVAHRIETEKDRKESDAHPDEEEDDAGEEFDVWEKLSQENCEWTLLIGKLEDVSLLNIVISNKPICNPVLPTIIIESRSDVSLKYILDGGRGSVSEIVARWLTSGGVSPEELIIDDLNAKKPQEETVSDKGKKNDGHDKKGVDNKVVDKKRVDKETVNKKGVGNKGVDKKSVDKNETQTNSEVLLDLKSYQQPVFYHLNIIKQQFPYSLEPSVLLANMCWEYVLAWQKDIQNIQLLEAAVKCLTYIPNLHIKTGVYNLVWCTHIKIRYESVCKLIHKVGKLPKERLCKQDTDLTDYQITLFSETCAQFFDGFMETLLESWRYEKPTLQYEPIWENGGKPLAELALTQTSVNYELLDLHYQLSLVLHMMTVFGIKHIKILNNLFDISSAQLFFTDLQQKASFANLNRDSKVSASRLQFLIKVISSTIDIVTINEGETYCADHVGWMAKCLQLARVWGLDVDMLKRYQVAQLFSGGFDALGVDLLGAISDKSKLGPDLLNICGKRLLQMLASSKDLGASMAACSTRLTSYLDSLDGSVCAASDLESTMLLITHTIRCLDEKQSDYAMACMMLEACSILQDLAHENGRQSVS